MFYIQPAAISIQKNKYLPGLATGEYIPCFGLTGPNNGSDATGSIDEGDFLGYGMSHYLEHIVSGGSTEFHPESYYQDLIPFLL